MRHHTAAGHLIRQARRQAELGQAELADVCGIPASRLSEYENGRRDPTVNTLLRVLAACGRTIRLADAAESDIANPYINASRLQDVLDLADAVASSEPQKPRALAGVTDE